MHRVRAQLPFHALVSVLLTWPLALHATDSLPYGTEQTGTVPLFNLWTLRWDQRQLGDLFRHYWDAPIFHPTAGAFALSEPQPLTGLFFTPIAWLTRNPVLAYNLTLLTILTLNGWAAARLARRLGVAAWPAALAGVVAQGLPFVSNQLGVLQLTVLFPVFFLTDAILAWAPAGGRRRGLAIGWWLAVTFLTCGYYGLFVSVVLPLAALVLARRAWFTWARALDLVCGGALCAVLTLPVLLGQAHYTQGYTRSDATIEGLSAMPVDFLRLHPAAHGSSLVPWLQDSGGTEHWLYPGTLLLIAAAAGAVVGVRTRPELRRTTLFLVVAVFLALLFSVGLRADIGGFNAYQLLRDVVPGFQNLRSPFRFAVLVQVLLVPLAAVALDGLWRWRPTIGPPLRTAVGPALACAVVWLGLLEVVPVPLRVFPVEQAQPDWSRWLAEHRDDRGSGDGSVAMVPFPPNGRVESYEPTVRGMLDGLDHDHPLVNGYSGFFPPTYDELEAVMRGFPSESSVRELRDTGVSYVVVDRSFLTPEAQGWLRDWSAELQPVFEGRDAIVYRLNR